MSQANSGGNGNSSAGNGQASNNGNGHGAGAAASRSDDKGAAKRDADEAPVMAASSASTTESRSSGKSARTQKKTASGKSETRANKRNNASSSSRHNRPETGDKGVGPQPESPADQTGRGANAGDCDADRDVHPYCSTRNGSPSRNGNGNGEAKGKPCAGCVGKADNKYPKGQSPGPHRDGNRGYECDHNNGIGKSNPAHTGCTDSPDEPEKPEEPCKPGKCDSDGCPPWKDCDGGDECPSWKDCDSHGCPPWKDCGDDSCVGGECPTDEDKCERGDKECREDTTPPTVTPTCPDGDWNGMEEGCGTPPSSPEVGPEFEDEVAGVEQERTGPPAFVEMERPNRAPAEVAPSAGFLPDTGAGQFGLAALAGGVLLAAGGAVIAMRRPQAKR
jgi:LPXTG-motif cell wall-anchored protein